MSSGSSGRYQSKFFNFVNQQSRRLIQQWGSTFRNLQLATKWGVETLLYPVYIFLQSSDSSVKKLYTKEPAFRQRLQPHDTDLFSETPLATDRPIQRVLESVQYLPREETTINVSATSRFSNILELLQGKLLAHRPNKANLSQSLTIPDKALAGVNHSLQQDTFQRHLPMVRGVASDLMNHQLVLVSAENQILDILTPQQQARLTEKIVNEVGEYWHSWQLREAKQQAHLLPEINHILAKLTGDNSSKMPIPTGIFTKNILNTGKIVALLDAAIAQLEETAIVPAQQRSLEIVRVAQTQVKIFLYGQEQLNSRRYIVENFDDLGTGKQNVSALIAAALNYFFGVPSQKLLNSNFSEEELPQISYQSQHEYFTDDPWLDWRDLYGDADKMTEKIMQSSPRIKAHIPPHKSAGFSWKNKRNTQQKQQQKTNQNLHQARPQSHQAASDISPKLISPGNQESQPDWIETTATVLGYEKHLLEELLEWLDHAIVWLEKILANIFSFLQGLLQSK